jgi:hypothetical protein
MVELDKADQLQRQHFFASLPLWHRRARKHIIAHPTRVKMTCLFDGAEGGTQILKTELLFLIFLLALSLRGAEILQVR